jgi:CRP-like cAMP-binding protein
MDTMRLNPTEAARLYLQGLASLHLRQRVSDADIAWVFARTPPIELPAGQIVLRQGDPADSALLVVHGELSASVHTGTGEREVGSVGPWDVLGETALFAPQESRSATVRAVRDSVCLQLHRSLFTEGRENPVIAAIEYHLLHTLAQRIRLTTRGITESNAQFPTNPDQGHQP